MAGEIRQAKARAEAEQNAFRSLGLSNLLDQVGELTQRRYFTAVVLVCIIGFATLLRLWGTNWDSGHHIHPDERFLTFVEVGTALPSSLGEYFNSEQSPLNPYNRGFGDFFYGTFPLFFVRIVAEVLGKADYGNINLVGRVVAGLFDVGTVLLVFLLGRRLYGRNVGLLAAFLMSVSVLNIQHAHFFVVESFLTFFSLLTVYYSVGIAQDGGWRNYALAGLALGFAVACKLTALPLLGIIGVAAVIRNWSALVSIGQEVWRRRPWAHAPDSIDPIEFGEPGKEMPYRTIGWAAMGLVLALFAAFMVFRIAQPYAFSSSHLPIIEWFYLEGGLSDNFLDDIEGIRNLTEGKSDFPPAIQWIGREPYWFAFKNMTWGMGPALALAAWGGVLYAGWRTVRYQESRHLLLLVWILGNFGYIAGRFVPSMRYLLPIYPQMVLLAAFGLWALWDANWKEPLANRLGSFYRYAKPAVPMVAKGALVATILLTALWALAFTSIYRRPLSRIEASEWIYSNVPDGASLGIEHWDDGLPFSLPDGRIHERYAAFEMSPYDPDGNEKLFDLTGELDRADYVILSSNRLYESIPRVPARYPMTSRYYELLFQERLGFEIAATFTSYPSLLGIEIPDQGAEEAFTVYDHPKVTIFKKTAAYNAQEVATLLYDSRPDSAVHLVPGEAATNGLILRPGERETQQNGGTWSDLFNPDGLTNRFPLIAWLLVVELAALALVPLAVILFRKLPDGGYLLTKPLAILALAYPVWFGASLGIFHFTRGSSLAVLFLLVLVGALAAYRLRERVRDYVRQHWRLILFGEALFLIAFLAFYFVRLENPDLWHAARGGEKPMDFAYLNAITRSTTLPPYDPWFAGGYLNYYYYGHFMTANLVKMTGIVPEVAYNLAVPLFFAVGVSAAFSVGYNLAETSRRLLRRRPGGLPIPAWTTVLAGLTAVFLVVLAGNLKSADVMIDRLEVVSPWHTGVPVLDSVLAVALGGPKVIFGSAELGRYDYWEPSRTIITDPNNNAITEFPYFTFLFADLHAHLMAIPFTLLSLGLGLALVLNARSDTAPQDELSSARWRRWLPTVGLVIVLALVVGALRWINSWDYPTFLIMALAAVFIAERARAGVIDIPMLRRTALLGALLALSSLAFFQPFSSNYALPATGFQGMPSASELPRTPFDQYLSHFGLFIFLVGSLLTFLSYRLIRRRGAGRFFMTLVWTVLGVFAATTLILALAGPASRIIPGITITDLSAGKFLGEIVSNDIPVAAFSLFAVAVVAILLLGEFRASRPDAPIRLVVLGLAAMAFILSAGVEIAVLNPDIGRQNTVFKFYLQIWTLLAVASSFAVWYLAAAVAPRWNSLRERLLNIRLRAPASLLRPAFLVVLVLLLLGAVVYPLQATPWRVRLADRAVDASRQDGKLVAAGGTTNNGMAYMQNAVYQEGEHTIELKYDYDAIMWLRNRVAGSPVIMEAVTPEYRWGSRYAIYTGLPAVVGWRFHQTQQRGRFAPMVEARIADVNRFYSTIEVGEAESILHKYGVSYVIVGQVEGIYYPAEGIAKFESMAGGSLEPVYHNDKTIIYHVAGTAPPRLASANSAP